MGNQQPPSALVLFENLASPELQRKLDAQRFATLMAQKAPAECTPQQFLGHLEYVHHKGSHILDDDFHMVPTRTRDRNGNWHTSFESVASVHWFRKRGYEHPDYMGRFGPEFGWVNDDGSVTFRPDWPFQELPVIARFGVRVKKLDGQVVWTYLRWDECARKTKEGKLLRQWAEQSLWMFAKNVEVRGWRAALPNAFGNTHSDDEILPAEVTVVEEEEEDEKPSRPHPTPTQQPEPVEAEVLEEEPAPSEPEEQADEQNSEEAAPDRARREVLRAQIKEGITKHTAHSTGNPKWIDVRAVCSMLNPPGPCGKTYPKFEEFTIEQLEQMVSLYESFDETPYERPAGFEGTNLPEESKPEEGLTQKEQTDRRAAGW